MHVGPLPKSANFDGGKTKTAYYMLCRVSISGDKELQSETASATIGA